MTPLQGFTIAAAVSAGVASGTTYAFSTFVMRALDKLPQADAIRAMQSINNEAISPLFLAALLGTGPAVAALAFAHRAADHPAGLLWAATAVYLVGVVGVTVAGNVPLNEALDRVVAASAEPGTWARYAQPWLRYNHLRTAMAALSAGLLIVSVAR